MTQMISTVSDKPNLTVTVTTEKSEFEHGELPKLIVVLRNNGRAPIELCTYMLRHRLLWAINVKASDRTELVFTCFRSMKFDDTSTAQFKTLKPGEQIVEVLDLADFAQKGWGFVHTAKQSPTLEENDAVALEKGAYTFATGLSPWAVVRQDRRVAMARVPDDLNLQRDVSKVFRGEVAGSAKITVK